MTKKKSKKKQIAVQVQEHLTSELMSELKSLNETYQKHHLSLLKIKRDETDRDIAIIEANKLQTDILKLLNSSTELVKNNPINDALLLYMKLKMIYGFTACFTRKYELAIVTFHNVFQYLIRYNNTLKYEDDVSFQYQIENIISECNIIHQKKLCKGSTDKIIEDGQAAYSLFAKRSTNTIVGLQMKFARHAQWYLMGYMNTMNDQLTLLKLNAQYKEYRREFFLSAEKIKRTLDSKNARNELTIEEQLHYLTLHFFMLNIEEMTHPHTVWKVVSIYNKEAFMIADNLTNIKLGDYFEAWRGFKKTYIAPSIELIKKINWDDFHSRIDLHEKYENIINKWRAYFHMSIRLCGDTPKILIRHIEMLKEQGADYEQDQTIVYNSIADIEKEREFLSSSVYVIEDFATKCHHQLAESLRGEAEKISTSEGKIETLKDEVEHTKQAKIKVANEHANELIGEEEAKATARKEKMQQRLLKKPTFFHDVQHELEKPVRDDETILDTLTLMDPELQKLEAVDEQAEHLARALKSKTDNLIKFIQGRANFKVPLPSTCHIDIYSQINYMLVEYHQLIVLFDEHQFLSQQNEYPENTQEGIAIAQNDLQLYCKQIFSNIKQILEMVDNIIELQKQSKNELILKIGYAQFVSIGRQKTANNQKLSEHTQQKELLELLQLTFSALNYLQDKIQAYIFNDHNEAIKKLSFFSRKETHGKHAELSNGRYEGLLGLIFNQRFDETGDRRYLLESKMHFINAYNAFEADEEKEALQLICEYLNAIEELLTPMNEQEVASMQMK